MAQRPPCPLFAWQEVTLEGPKLQNLPDAIMGMLDSFIGEKADLGSKLWGILIVLESRKLCPGNNSAPL